MDLYVVQIGLIEQAGYVGAVEVVQILIKVVGIVARAAGHTHDYVGQIVAVRLHQYRIRAGARGYEFKLRARKFFLECAAHRIVHVILRQHNGELHARAGIVCRVCRGKSSKPAQRDCQRADKCD